jgi:S1-C subfamily serine protease
MNPLLKQSAIVLGAAVIGGGVVAVGADHAGNTTKDVVTVTRSSDTPQPAADTTSAGNNLSASEIYKEDAPGVVVVKNTFTQNSSTGLGMGQPQTEEALGSGFVIDNQGHILTNAHVVAGSNVHVTVGFASANGQDVTYPAKVLGSDPKTDVAVLQPEQTIPSDLLHPLPLGNLSSVQVGEPVVAIGNPLGEDRTITEGIVSALNREITSPGNTPITNAIQTDAAINHGNSGGPLINSSGQVIGITSQILTGQDSETAGSIGIGFAIPINTAETIANELISTGHASHPYVGVEGVELSSDLSKSLGISTDHGFLVTSVKPNSPGASAGLKGGTTTKVISGQKFIVGGDIITAIDGKQINSFTDLYNTIAAHKAGDVITLTVVRNGQTSQVQVTLADQS